MGALRERMIEEMKLRNFSAATQKTYLYAVTRLAKYYGKAPDQLSKEDIRAFLLHLLVERKLSPNGLTGYCSGLRFFYNLVELRQYWKRYRPSLWLFPNR